MAEEFAEEVLTSKISVYTPIIYVGILLSTLVAFSIIYRRRNLAQLQNMAPFFPENLAKELYIQLKNQDPKPNEKVLKAALIRRGSEAIRRMLKLRENQNYLNVLYQKGSIGDEIFESSKIAAKLQELEMQELAREAESFKAGWAQVFFPVCQEVTINEALRRRINAVESRREALSPEWITSVLRIEAQVKMKLEQEKAAEAIEEKK